MVKSLLAPVIFLLCSTDVAAFSLSKGGESKAASTSDASGSRRSFLSTSIATVVGGASVLSQAQPSFAAPEIITLPSGVKYAVTQASPNKKTTYANKGDIVAIDYTGYLANGQIFDATHAAGKSSSLQFKVGTGSVIPGLDVIVAEMEVGQKVQAIIPPSLAYGDKGVCLDDGECLIKPGSTLVYDVFLKKTSIPPP